MSKRMTLVVGALCDNGMVFCSDTEEGTGGGGKRDVHKLFEFQGKGWGMLVGTAGFGPICDIAAHRIEAVAKSQDFILNPEGILGDVMAKVYEKYIPKTLPDWKQQERQISLVIGIVNSQAPEVEKMSLYQTTEEIVHPIQHHFACAGVGQEIAYYILDRVFDRALKYHEASELLQFVMREAKQSVGNVGGNTEMVIFTNGSRGVHRSTFGPGWEARQPRLSDVLNKFWIEKSH